MCTWLSESDLKDTERTPTMCRSGIEEFMQKKKSTSAAAKWWIRQPSDSQKGVVLKNKQVPPEKEPKCVKRFSPEIKPLYLSQSAGFIFKAQIGSNVSIWGGRQLEIKGSCFVVVTQNETQRNLITPHITPTDNSRVRSGGRPPGDGCLKETFLPKQSAKLIHDPLLLRKSAMRVFDDKRRWFTFPRVRTLLFRQWQVSNRIEFTL